MASKSKSSQSRPAYADAMGNMLAAYLGGANTDPGRKYLEDVHKHQNWQPGMKTQQPASRSYQPATGSGGNSKAQQMQAQSRPSARVIDGPPAYYPPAPSAGQAAPSSPYAPFDTNVRKGGAFGELPDFQKMNDIAGQTYYDYAAGDRADPLTAASYNHMIDPTARHEQVMADLQRYRQDTPAYQVAPNTIVNQQASDQAVDYLNNGPSLFDTIDGSNPYVDRINEITAARQANLRDQFDERFEEATANQNAQLAESGLISSSQALEAHEDLVRGSIQDFTAQALEMDRNDLHTLGQLAIQDAQRGSNNAQILLEIALGEKTTNTQAAVQRAAQDAESLVRLAEARLRSYDSNAQTGLQLGQQDYSSSKDSLLGTAMAPLNAAVQLATGTPNVGTTKSKSK